MMKPDLLGGPTPALTEALLGQETVSALSESAESPVSFSSELSDALLKTCPSSEHAELAPLLGESVKTNPTADQDPPQDPALQAACAAFLICLPPPKAPPPPELAPLDETAPPATLVIGDQVPYAAAVCEPETTKTAVPENAAGIGSNCRVKDALESLPSGTDKRLATNREQPDIEKPQTPATQSFPKSQPPLELPSQTIPGGSRDLAGTFAAQEHPPMNQVLATERVCAAAPEKVSGADTNQLKAEHPRGPRPRIADLPVEVTWTASPTHFAPDQRTASVSPSGASVPAGPLPMAQSIMHEVRLLGTVEGSALAVVLRPDGQTEVKLRLEYRDGKIEAAATCERGDFNALNAHWPELRRALEVQGVSLSELERGTATMSNQQDGRRQQPERPSEAPAAENFPTKPFKPDTAQNPRGRAPVMPPANSLLESWA